MRNVPKRFFEIIGDPRILFQITVLSITLAMSWGMRAGELKQLRSDVDRIDTRGTTGLIGHEIQNEREYAAILRRLDVLAVEMEHVRDDIRQHDKRGRSCGADPLR